MAEWLRVWWHCSTRFHRKATLIVGAIEGRPLVFHFCECGFNEPKGYATLMYRPTGNEER